MLLVDQRKEEADELQGLVTRAMHGQETCSLDEYLSVEDRVAIFEF